MVATRATASCQYAIVLIQCIAVYVCRHMSVTSVTSLTRFVRLLPPSGDAKSLPSHRWVIAELRFVIAEWVSDVMIVDLKWIMPSHSPAELTWGMKWQVREDESSRCKSSSPCLRRFIKREIKFGWSTKFLPQRGRGIKKVVWWWWGMSVVGKHKVAQKREKRYWKRQSCGQTSAGVRWRCENEEWNKWMKNETNERHLCLSSRRGVDAVQRR